VETHYYVNDVSKQIAMLALVFSPKDKFNDLLGKYVEISSKIKKSRIGKAGFELLYKLSTKTKKQQSYLIIVDTAIKAKRNLF